MKLKMMIMLIVMVGFTAFSEERVQGVYKLEKLGVVLNEEEEDTYIEVNQYLSDGFMDITYAIQVEGEIVVITARIFDYDPNPFELSDRVTMAVYSYDPVANPGGKDILQTRTEQFIVPLENIVFKKYTIKYTVLRGIPTDD